MNKYKYLAALGIVAGALSAGCATVNTSYLDGDLQSFAHMHRYPVRVLAIDGDYVLSRNPVQAEPGQHVFRISAPPVAGFHNPVVREVKLTIEPCKRYYLAADRKTGLSQDWELVVDRTEDLAGCRIDVAKK